MLRQTTNLLGIVLGLTLFISSPYGIALAEPGVEVDRIVFGQSAAFKGPAAALGTGMREGVLAAFEEANSEGGVHGRRLELISYNDGYEPGKAIENTIRLVQEDEVFALVGEVGTPTSKAVQPIATEFGVPFIGPFTGASFLRDPTLTNVINIRASYDQETEAWIAHLVDGQGFSRVAILYQDDSFGRAGLAGVRSALRLRGLSLVAEGTYKRNTTAVKRALLAVRKANPEAVVIVGAYKPAAEFIRLARSLGVDPVFMTISFVGSRALADELGAGGTGVLVTQVVPLPEDRSVPLVAQYQNALRARDTDAKYGFVSLEGYLVGRLIADVLEKMGPKVSRGAFLDHVQKLGEFEIGELALSYGPDDNQGSDRVFITRIGDDGRFQAVSE